MRKTNFLAAFLLCWGLGAENLEKTQKKDLEARVRTMTAEAQKLEKSGHLAEARTKYAESQALIEMKDVTDALKHLDEEIHKRVKTALQEAHKLYEAGKYKESVAVLDAAMKLQAFQSVLAFDLALCHHQLGARSDALEYLTKAKAATAEPKQKQKMLELSTFFTTGENASAVKDSDRDRISRINRLADSIGLEASLEDEGGAEDSISEEGTPPAAAASTALKTDRSVNIHGESYARHRASLCNALGELKGTVASSPSATFDLANCAESNGRTSEAVHLLEKYLEMAPKALDAAETRARVADLKSLLALPAPNGAEIRRLNASAYGALEERQYGRALASFNKAAELAPDFPLTRWQLALLYEAMGDIVHVRENFNRYQQLIQDPAAREEAALHLSTLDAKREKYDAEVDEAGDIVADLLNRSMNLTFNSEKRSAIRAKRASVTKKDKKAQSRAGGFAVPFAYAQQQLGLASEHLQIALALFPLGTEANQLMGQVFLQANDGHAATKSFDVIASQGLPAAFYAEMRGQKQDRAVKVELNRDGLRLIFLSSYDKKGKPAPPKKPAGEDGLGDLVIDPTVARAQFESMDVAVADIKRVETDKGLLKLKISGKDIYLSPIYLPSYTPVQGPQGRRFANNYTRLFVRYPGLENSKLGAEGMTGGEKFAMGYKLASAGFDMATNGFTVIGIISSVQDAISIARTIHGAMVSLRVTFAAWEKTVSDQQRLLAGKAFKSIPTQPANLAFAHETK